MSRKRCWLPVALVLIACAGFPVAMWLVADASFKNTPHVQKLQPPRNDGLAQRYQDKASLSTSGLRFDIECAPNCKAKESDGHKDRHPIVAFLYKVLEDPVALLTAIVVLANWGVVFGVVCQVRDFRNFNKRQSRAYIGHEPMGAHFARSTQTGALKYFEFNFGKTPASNVEMFVRVVPGTDIPQTTDQTFKEEEQQDVIGYVPPGQNIGRIVTTPNGKIWHRDEKFFIYGHVDYTDIYKRRWRRRFGFSHDYSRTYDGGEEWIAHGKHHYERRLRKNRNGSWRECPAWDEAD